MSIMGSLMMESEREFEMSWGVWGNEEEDDSENFWGVFNEMMAFEDEEDEEDE